MAIERKLSDELYPRDNYMIHQLGHNSLGKLQRRYVPRGCVEKQASRQGSGNNLAIEIFKNLGFSLIVSYYINNIYQTLK